jgi:hypothetical protein
MIRMKPILPKDAILDARKLARAKKNALDGAAKGALIDFKTTAATWDHTPDFAIETPSDDERIVGTDDEIYGYVEGGTRPHVIQAKAGGVLAFGPGAKAKTRPRVIGSGSGSKGGATVFRPRVNHPGTDAREFSVVIAEKWNEQLPLLLQRAIDAVLL